VDRPYLGLFGGPSLQGMACRGKACLAPTGGSWIAPIQSLRRRRPRSTPEGVLYGPGFRAA